MSGRLLHALAVALVAAGAVVAVLLFSDSAWSASKLETLRAREARQVQAIERAKLTLRFFERHPKIVYSKNLRVKKRAWHVIAVARSTIIRTRIKLARTRAAIRKAQVPRCLNYPDGPARARCIVYAVFPDATQDAALRVVACETGRTFDQDAFNGSSAATGYFQVLQGNAGRRLHGPPTWDDRSPLGIVIPSGRALFEPWTNARVAFYLSHGGWYWGEWACKP